MKVKIVATALLIATALATNYALIWLLNIKLMDGIIFLISYAFGVYYGLIAAIIIWVIYGTLNPYGFNLLSLMIVISGEMVYVIFGSLLRKIYPLDNIKSIINGKLTIVALFGLISTLFYDLYTNALVGIIWYNSWLMGLLTMNFPYPFGLVHEISNLFLIPLVLSAGVLIMKRTGII
jgi:hypothetical protein